MATLVLTVAGNILGGPIGASIGAFVGQQIDREIFKGPAREGPRLKELDVQTSSYGRQIPAIFGAMRVAGSVIWSTDLIEKRTKESGGKGQPSNINYSYSVNMAIALSSRPVARVGRIWADGNLIRGAAGDLKVATQFRFYSGYGDQKPDPLIASSESSQAPAHRGICYAVFEDLQLQEFGNRIPSLTFELFESDGKVSLCDIAKSVSPIFDACHTDEEIAGYALQGADAKAAIAPLLSVMPVIARPENGRIALLGKYSSALKKIPVSIAVANNAKPLEIAETTREPALVPNALSLRHYDPARDYQISAQQSNLADTGRRTDQIDLPAVISAQSARRLVNLQLVDMLMNSSGWSAYILRDENDIQIGDYAVDANTGSYWQISEIEQFGTVSLLTARRPGPDNDYIMETQADILDGGRSISAPDSLIGESYIALLDLPVITRTDPGRTQIAVAASGYDNGWRGAVLSKQTPNGLLNIGATANPAVIGKLENIVQPHSADLTDHQNEIIVRLVDKGSSLPEQYIPLTDSRASLYWIGGELIRAARTQAIGTNLYRLSELQRGCFGSEAFIVEHQIDEALVYLEEQTLRLMESEDAVPGSNIVVEATGLGDLSPAIATLQVTGRAIKPHAPVHGRGARDAMGALNLKWVRRNRVDHGWQDGVDQPLDEDGEIYSVALTVYGTEISTWNCTQPSLKIDAAEIAAWNLPADSICRFGVSQIGRFAKSDEMIIEIIV